MASLFSPSSEDIIKKRFSTSGYIFSIAGIPKILAIILYIVAGILFLTENDENLGCRDEVGNIRDPPSWYPWLFPLVAVTSAVASALIYSVFVLGCLKRYLNFWVTLDLALAVLLILTNLVICILVITSCPAVDAVNNVPAPLGLVATALLIVCAAATYYNWRNGASESPRGNLQRETTSQRNKRSGSTEPGLEDDESPPVEKEKNECAA